MGTCLGRFFRKMGSQGSSLCVLMGSCMAVALRKSFLTPIKIWAIDQVS